MSDEKVILVAFVVDAESEAEAEDYLREVVLPADYPAGLEGWWVAEDGRAEGSDNDSAVFVPKGRQAEAYDILRKAFKDNADYQAWTRYEFGPLASDLDTEQVRDLVFNGFTVRHAVDAVTESHGEDRAYAEALLAAILGEKQ